MGIRELDTTLNDEQKAIRKAARKFFSEVWRPAAIELDRMATPEEVIREDSVLWEVFRKSNELGYHKMSAPEEIGGMGMADPLISAIINEEMGYASPGLAVGYAVNGTPYTYAAMSAVPARPDG